MQSEKVAAKQMIRCRGRSDDDVPLYPCELDQLGNRSTTTHQPAAKQPCSHQRNDPQRRRRRFRHGADGVREIVQVNDLGVAVDVRGDEAEAIEVGADLFVTRIEIERNRLTIERHGDAAAPVVGGRIVVQCPVVRIAVGVDERWRGCAAAAVGPHPFWVEAVGWVKIKPFRAGPLDRRAHEVLGRRRVLRVVAPHAVCRVKESEQRGAVADPAVERNLALGVQRLVKRR